jgi:hypothetical protein
MARIEAGIAQADKLTSLRRETGPRAHPIRLRGYPAHGTTTAPPSQSAGAVRFGMAALRSSSHHTKRPGRAARAGETPAEPWWRPQTAPPSQSAGAVGRGMAALRSSSHHTKRPGRAASADETPAEPRSGAQQTPGRPRKAPGVAARRPGTVKPSLQQTDEAKNSRRRWHPCGACPRTSSRKREPRWPDASGRFR